MWSYFSPLYNWKVHFRIKFDMANSSGLLILVTKKILHRRQTKINNLNKFALLFFKGMSL